ncbi:hypothetical protein SGLAD_v1c01020 [Spiroplasma gladiatoris]|uniref:Uncharacterized protein n=1 Tax=Spiroplasma gladiatoris TaxID=2143 RepID=A0A4P7AI04_9MOLU|nr:hypothetical protein [Spiroplasma gladiatoris]QBQ07303.1 hypothetical protein SGLAD_v1c01020 [Spiroplasma gladiatoris]
MELTQQRIIYLSVAIAFFVLMIILMTVKLILDKKNKVTGKITLKDMNYTGLAGVWQFTKRHIWSFAIIACLGFGVIAVILMLQ